MLSFQEHMQFKPYEAEIREIACIMEEKNIDPVQFFENWGKWLGAIPGALAGGLMGGPAGALAGGWLGYKGGSAMDKMATPAPPQSSAGMNIPAIKQAIVQMAKAQKRGGRDEPFSPMQKAIQQVMQGLNTIQQQQQPQQQPKSPADIAAAARDEFGGGDVGDGDIPTQPVPPSDGGTYGLKPDFTPTPTVAPPTVTPPTGSRPTMKPRPYGIPTKLAGYQGSIR